MTKYFIWILFLFGCHSNSENHLKDSFISDTASNLTARKKRVEYKKFNKLFENSKPFEIVSFTNSLNKQTSDTDTIKCNHWNLNKSDIEKIIKNSKPIDGTTWDFDFLVLTCTKSVKITQSGQPFEIEINGASFFRVNNGDTSVLFGDYKKSDRKYFIEGPNNN